MTMIRQFKFVIPDHRSSIVRAAMSWSPTGNSSSTKMLDFLRNAFLHWQILVQLTKRDLVAAHHGSVLGAFWVLIDPLAYVALTLCFFQFAIKGAENTGVSYVAWVLPQIIFWTFASSAI